MISIGALLISACTFAVTFWYSRKSARQNEQNAKQSQVTTLREDLEAELDLVRNQHKRCESDLRTMRAEMQTLRAQYFYMLEEFARRGMGPRVAVPGVGDPPPEAT